MYNDITGIILSGGKSVRMGKNKSFLEIGGKSIIERTVSLMKQNYENVILITNSPLEYEFLKIPLFEDIVKGRGPLSGIHAGLMNSATEKNFIISCDMPLVDSSIIKYIVEYPSEELITITRADGFIQQLCGLYSKKVIPFIEKIFSESEYELIRDDNQKNRKCEVLSLVKLAGGKIIEIEKEFTGYKKDSFININKKEDYEKMIESIDTGFF